MSLKLDQGQAEFIQMKTGINIGDIILNPIKRWPPIYTTMALGEEDSWRY